jgi:glycosyltransferase involved in cell wall biosynthesis
LAIALATHFPEDEIWLLSDQSFPHPHPALRNLKAGSAPSGFVNRRWWLWGLPAQLREKHADVFHGTDFAVPYRAVRPSVLTLHDLSPWLDPAWHSAAQRVRHRTPVLLKLGLATLVLTPTEAIRREAISRFHLAPERVVSIPHAASSLFRPAVVDPPAVPYFLFVGTLEPRKNLLMALEAWRVLRRSYSVDLVLAGRRRADFPELTPEPGLRILGEVPNEALPGLYSGCLACLYPSFYEGFGLPVLEAMQCGAAVVASTDPAVLETSGGAALHADARDTAAWVGAMRAVLEIPDRVRSLREASLRRAAEFSWHKTALRTREVYEEAIRRFRGSR